MKIVILAGLNMLIRCSMDVRMKSKGLVVLCKNKAHEVVKRSSFVKSIPLATPMPIPVID